MVRLVDDQLFGKDPDKRVEDPDLIDGGLRSKQFATVIDLLGYGEIEGPRKPSNTNPDATDSLEIGRDIFLDNTPITNSNGTSNFSNVDVFFKNGAINQTPVKEINAIENTIPVGVALTNSPFATTKTGSYTLAGSGGQTVSGVSLGANQMLVNIANHGYSVGEVVQWTNDSPAGTVQTANPQTQNILSVPDSGKFVINTTFQNTSFAGNCVVKTSQGLSRTINGVTNLDGKQLVDKLRVTIQFPALQEFKDDGDVIGAEAKISIRVTENNGTINNPVILDVTNGKASSPYVKDYELVFERTMNFPLTLSVFRNTDDGTDAKLQNSTNWLSFTEIQSDVSAYEGFAYIALRFNAQEFRSYPRRMYRIKGTKIKVPSGTTVDVDNGRVIYPDDYTFDGTFKANKEWCSDPAWVLYDILTTDKGFGDKLNSDGSVAEKGIVQEENLDVFSFFSASKYASALITDPITATTEPRFSCNVILNQRNDAYNLINDLCSVMNAMPFYSNGTLQISQDRPTNTTDNTSDPQYVFNNSNVTEEGFTYQNQAARLKYTEVEVQYFDNETQTMEFELVTADQITALGSGSTGLDAINKFGRTRKTLKAFACTSIGQANRLGRWFLYTNLLENEVVTFTTTLEAGVIVRPATIIAIADSVRSGVRKGGRIKTGVSTTQIVVDARTIDGNDLTHESGSTLTVILPNGKASLPRTISSINGTTITVSSAFVDEDGNTATPQANSVYVIESPSTQLQIFKVVSIEEKNDSEYTITAVIHDTNKYAQVEDTTVPLNPRTITSLIKEAPSPSNLSAVEQIVVLKNRAVSKIFVSWQPVLGVKEYLVEFQYEKDNPERTRVARPSFELFESRLGSYTFKVKSFNALGVLSSTTSTVDIQAVGKTEKPEDPTGLTSEPVSDSFIKLRFDPSTSVDVTHGGAVSVRHTSDTSTNASFANSVEIIQQLAGNVSETLVPALTGTYSIKFIDDGGRRSENEAKIIVTKPDPQPNQIVVTKREDQTTPKFNGTRVRTVFSDQFNGLVLDGTEFFDNVTDVNAIANFDFLGAGIASQGFYTFVDDLDLGAVFNLSLERHFKTAGIVVSDLWDSRVQLVDNMPDWDGTIAEDVGAKLQVSSCQGVADASLSASYSQTQDLITITKSSHGAAVNEQFLIDFTSGSATNGFLKVVSITSTDIFVVEAVRQIAEYEIINASTGEIRIFTDGNHGGLVANDTVKLVFNTGTAVSGDYIVGATQALGVVSITTSTNNSVTNGTVEFIKIKDNSGNNITNSGSCNISSPYSTFNTFANGEFTARGFRFRAELFSNDPDQNIEIDELGYTASMKRRTETVNTAIASACATNNSAKTVSFGNAFYTGTSVLNSSTSAFLPTIGITLEGAVSGDYFKITSVTGTQFVIETRDASNNFKDLSFKYTAIGFGKGV